MVVLDAQWSIDVGRAGASGPSVENVFGKPLRENLFEKRCAEGPTLGA
jgi:hypothetical protein